MVRFADIFKKKMAEAAATQAETRKSPFAHINSPGRMMRSGNRISLLMSVSARRSQL
ncbi:MAG: hypothetical protein HY762_05020 [Planctomycetes bacterium]|nr:hypothetical protein [Planctomycetota bacterium]